MGVRAPEGRHRIGPGTIPRRIGDSGSKTGSRFSRSEARPSRISGPTKPSLYNAVEATNAGPMARSQSLSAYLVQRIELGAPAARRAAISTAWSWSASSSTHNDTRPHGSASTPGARQDRPGRAASAARSQLLILARDYSDVARKTISVSKYGPISAPRQLGLWSFGRQCESGSQSPVL